MLNSESQATTPNVPEDVVTWMGRMFEGARFRFDILDDCTLTDAQKVEKARALISEFAAALLAARREVERMQSAIADTERLDWLQSHDSYELLRCWLGSNKPDTIVHDNDKHDDAILGRGATIREAIDAARAALAATQEEK